MTSAPVSIDALRLVDFDAAVLGNMAADFAGFRELAHAGKIAQGRFIARRRGA